MKKYFYLISKFLQLISYYLTFFQVINFKFFFDSNETLTADFLSRFFCTKLKQGYSLSEILNPICRELKRVQYLGKVKIFYSKYTKFLGKNLIFRHGVIKSLFSYIFLFYRNYLFFYYKINYILCSFDMFIVFF